MKKTLSMLLALLIFVTTVTTVSAKTNSLTLTDLVNTQTVSGLENVDIISKASSDNTLAILAYDSNYDIVLYTSTNGTSFLSFNLINSMSAFLPEEELYDHNIRNIQFVNNTLFIFGYYITEENFDYKEYLIKYDAVKSLYDYATFDFGFNGEFGNSSPQIEKCNGKYVYYFEDCSALYNATGENMGNFSQYSIYSVYYISDDLKTWEQVETPSFYGHSIDAGYSRFKMSVSGTGITVIGYVHYYSGDSETPSIEIFASTTDFKNYTNLNTSVFDEVADAPYTFSYNLAALNNENIALFFQRAYKILDEDYYPYYYYKYFDCYLIDVEKGSVENIITDSNDEGMGFFFVDMYPEMSVVTFNDNAVNIFNYSYESGDVTKNTLNRETFLNSKIDFSNGEPDFWDYSETETLFIGYSEKDENIVSITNYNYSKTYLLNVEQTERLFVWNEKDLAYFYSDNNCICISLSELMAELTEEDNPSNPDTPANPDNPDNPIEPDEPSVDKEPLAISISSYSEFSFVRGESTIIDAEITGTVPENTTIVWSADNSNFKTVDADDGFSCIVTASAAGETTLTVKVIGADGKTLAEDSQTIIAEKSVLDIIMSILEIVFGFFFVFIEIVSNL